MSARGGNTSPAQALRQKTSCAGWRWQQPWVSAHTPSTMYVTALASTYGHLLPTYFPGFQDSSVSPPHIGVTWYSWVSLAVAIGTGILFGCTAHASVAVSWGGAVDNRVRRNDSH